MKTKYENVKETVEKLGEAASPNEDIIKFMLEWKCLQYSSWTTKGLLKIRVYLGFRWIWS